MMLSRPRILEVSRQRTTAFTETRENSRPARQHKITLSFVMLVVAFVIASSAQAARATEHGLTEYPQGVDTALPALAPPPDQTSFYNYLEYYSAGAYLNGSGKSAIPGFSETYTADAIRVLHTWKFVSGHFSFSTGIVPTLLNVSLKAGGVSQSRTNFTDLVLQPLFVNYVSTDHKLWAIAGIGMSLPTGSYKSKNFLNTGLNITTVDTDQVVTWFPNPRTQASLKFAEEFATNNPSNQYHSGTTVDLDYALEYSPGKAHSKFHYGLQGFISRQVSNDTLAGNIVNNGNFERANAVGPQFRYDVIGGGFILKLQREFGVTNHTQGDHYWFEFALPL